jgi:hypothetical protein
VSAETLASDAGLATGRTRNVDKRIIEPIIRFRI